MRMREVRSVKRRKLKKLSAVERARRSQRGSIETSIEQASRMARRKGIAFKPDKAKAALEAAHADAAELGIDPQWALGYLPKVLPPAWRRIDVGMDGERYMREDGLRVIMSGSVAPDGKRWLHVSLSREARLPNWGDLKHVRDVFLGPEKTAYQIIAPTSEWINMHKFCLHLWHCVDGDPLPDFTRGSMSI